MWLKFFFAETGSVTCTYVINENTFQTFTQIGHTRELKPSSVTLTSYWGRKIKVLGMVDVEVSY